MNDRVTLKLKVGTEVVDFATFEVDPGVTPEKQALIAQLRARAAIPAEQVLADADGCKLLWADGWPFVISPPAWKAWWGDRSPVEGEDARTAFAGFEHHLYGDEGIGGKLDAAIADGKMSLWKAVRDFPETIRHSPAIQSRLQEAYESGTPVAPGQGERSREDRLATLDRWMTTFSQVEEYRRAGKSLIDAFKAVAKAQGRGGDDPIAQIRGEYERAAKQWRSFFLTGPGPGGYIVEGRQYDTDARARNALRQCMQHVPDGIWRRSGATVYALVPYPALPTDGQPVDVPPDVLAVFKAALRQG